VLGGAGAAPARQADPPAAQGDWKGISRAFVPSRNPTQVASHAQKYYLRLAATTAPGGPPTSRASIHDLSLEAGAAEAPSHAPMPASAKGPRSRLRRRARLAGARAEAGGKEAPRTDGREGLLRAVRGALGESDSDGSRGRGDGGGDGCEGAAAEDQADDG